MKMVVKDNILATIMKKEALERGKFCVGILNTFVCGRNGPSKIIFPSYVSIDKWRLTGVYIGVMCNYIPNGNKDNYEFATYEKAFNKMVEICEAVYQVENWAEIAELAKNYNVKEF